MALILEIDKTHIDKQIIKQAVEILSNGGVIVYPTDTIYGLGCDITNQNAVTRVQQIKGRDPSKPMSFVCSDINQVRLFAEIKPASVPILETCLPGAYTFILPATDQTPSELRTTEGTVGLRIPKHNVPLSLVRLLGQPILSTSANFSDQEDLTDPMLLDEHLGNHVDLILSSGKVTADPSTVVSLVEDKPRLLRRGKGKIDILGF